MAMTAEKLRQRLRDGFAAKQTLRELRAIVVEFAAAGGRRDVATDVLEDLRGQLGDDATLLDLLDVICGFCEPALRMWSDDSYRRHHSGERVKR